MKKFLSLAISVVLLALCFAATVSAENVEPEDFTRIVATEKDPYGLISMDEALNPDTAKWAVIYYRLNTPLDSKGVGYIGQFYVYPETEPHIVIEYDTANFGVWNKIVVDMTTTGEDFPSRWTSATEGADFSVIRFDPLEVNRHAPLYGGEVLEESHVKDGDNIDVAYIAFFDDEAKANEFDGTQDTYVAMITADDIYYMTNLSGTYTTFKKDEVEPEEESSEEESEDVSVEESADASVEESTDASIEESADASAEESTDASVEESKAETSSNANSSTGDNNGDGDGNIGLIIGIIVAVVAVAAVVAVVIVKKKKQ